MTLKKSAHIQRPTAHLPADNSQGKRDVTKLTKAIVDGLEDVKAQNLMVFDTEHLSSLFERVIVASGTSNRQTKALAMSVRDAVSEAGFPKPRTEGEDNGEWIIVDCGPAVVHIMQPAIRQYYHLEDIWGEKPMRLKHAASEKEAEKLAEKAAQTAKKQPNKASAQKESARAAPKKIASKTTAVKTSATKSATKPAAKPVAKKPVAKPSPQAVAKKAAVKKAASSTGIKAAAKKAPAKKPAAKKSA